MILFCARGDSVADGGSAGQIEEGIGYRDTESPEKALQNKRVELRTTTEEAEGPQRERRIVRRETRNGEGRKRNAANRESTKSWESTGRSVIREESWGSKVNPVATLGERWASIRG